MVVRFLKPRLGFKAGHVADNIKLGVARTLIQFGVCEEVKDGKEVDSGSADKPTKPRRKRKRSKEASPNLGD